MPFEGRLPRPPTGGSHKFAMSLRLMRRPGTSQPLTHPRSALLTCAGWGPARSPWSKGQSAPGYRLLTGARRTDQRGRWSWVTFASVCWRSIAGTLSPAAMSAPWLSPGQLYRLLLIALQLALASNPVQISTRNQTSIPAAHEWFNGNHQAASPGLSGGGRPSVGFG